MRSADVWATERRQAPVLQLISSEPWSSQSLKKSQRSEELMHLPFAHKNSSFSHVGSAGGAAVDIQHTHRSAIVQIKVRTTARHSDLEPQLTAVHFIRVVAAVIDAVTPLRHLQAYAVILTAESSGGWTLEPPCERQRRKEDIRQDGLVTHKRQGLKQCFRCALWRAALTALVGVLVRVVSAVVLSVTPPGQRFTQSVVTLEFIQRAVTTS